MNTENEEKTLNFYIAVLVYESSSNALNYQKLYEESYVLIKASSDEDARLSINQCCKPHTYTIGATISSQPMHLQTRLGPHIDPSNEDGQNTNLTQFTI